MTNPVPVVTMTKTADRYVYTSQGNVLRTSKRIYKHALFGLSRQIYDPATKSYTDVPKGVWACVGFGNNPSTLVNSWKNIVHYEKLVVADVK